MALGVAASIAMARLGGAEVKGTYSSVMAAANLVFAVINLELAAELLKRGREDGTQNETHKWITKAWFAYGLAGVLACVLLWVLNLEFASFVAAASTLTTLSTQAGVLLNGKRGPTWLAAQAVVQQAATLLLVGVASTAVSLTNTLIVLILCLSLISGFLVAVFWLRSSSREPATVRLDLIGAVRRGSKWVLLRLSQMALMRLDIVVVYLVAGPAMAGVYSVGVSFATFIQLIPSQLSLEVQFLGANRIAYSLERKALSTFIVGVVAALPFAILGSWLIDLMYGSGFAGAYGVLLCSIPGIIALPAYQTYCNSLRLTSNHRMATGTGLAGVLVMVVLLVPALQIWGLPGAAIASSVGCVLSLGLMIVIYRARRIKSGMGNRAGS
ncbi:lipopolysaccharide biosynthesis protein [Dietzia maris]